MKHFRVQIQIQCLKNPLHKIHEIYVLSIKEEEEK